MCPWALPDCEFLRFTLFLVTSTVLRTNGPRFCRMALTLGLPNIFLRWDWGGRWWRGKPYRESATFIILSNIKCGHLAKIQICFILLIIFKSSFQLIPIIGCDMKSFWIVVRSRKIHWVSFIIRRFRRIFCRPASGSVHFESCCPPPST